jgi:hypothetical protein
MLMTISQTEKGPGTFQVVSAPAEAEHSKRQDPAICFREDPAAHSVDELSLVKHKIRLAPPQIPSASLERSPIQVKKR